MQWNPTAPRHIGLEQPSFAPLNGLIASSSVAQGLRWRAVETGPVSKVMLFSDGGGSSAGPSSGVSRRILAEIVPFGSEVHGPITYTDFPVSSVTNAVGVTNNSGFNTLGLAAPGDGKFVTMTPSGATRSVFDAGFATSGFTDGKHVLNMQLLAWHNNHIDVERRNPPAATNTQVDSFFASTHGAGVAPVTFDWGEAKGDTAEGTVDAYTAPWAIWNPSDIREFSNGERVLRIIKPIGHPPGIVEALTLRVWWMPERRLAVGLGVPQVDGWTGFDVTDPTYRGIWVKDFGVDYTLIVRRFVPWTVYPHADAGLSWRMITADPKRRLDPTWSRRSIALGTFDRDRLQPIAAGYSGTEDSGIPCCRLLYNGIDLPESQQYIGGWGLSSHNGAPQVKQRLIMTDGTPRPLLYAWVSDDLRPTGNLGVIVRRVSDGAIIATGTITPEMVQESNTSAPAQVGTGRIDGYDYNSQIVSVNFHRVRVDLGFYILTAGAFDVEFSTLEVTQRTQPWLVACLHTINTTTGAFTPNDQTYGGNEQYASGSLNIGTGTDYILNQFNGGDVAVTLASRPPPVQAVDVQVQGQRVEMAGNLLTDPDFELGAATLGSVAGTNWSTANPALSTINIDAETGSFAARLTNPFDGTLGGRIAQPNEVGGRPTIPAGPGEEFMLTARLTNKGDGAGGLQGSATLTIDFNGNGFFAYEFVDLPVGVPVDRSIRAVAINAPFVAQVKTAIQAGSPSSTDRSGTIVVDHVRLERVAFDPRPPTPGSGAPGGCEADPTRIPVIERAVLTWTYNPALLVAEFDHFEIERWDATSSWKLVASLTSPSASSFYDLEARIGVGTKYRIRNVRTDGAGSDWVECPMTVLRSRAAGDELTFTTNVAPDMTVALLDVSQGSDTPDRNFELPEAEETTLLALYGKDYRAAFRPTERRGVQFSRLVIVRSTVGAPPPTVDAFDRLRDLAHAPLPYVCVRDCHGNRWMAAVGVPSALTQRGAHRHLANVQITQLTEEPAVAETPGLALPEPEPDATANRVRKAIEFETARAVTRRKAAIVGQAVETDGAADLVSIRRFTSRLGTTDSTPGNVRLGI